MRESMAKYLGKPVIAYGVCTGRRTYKKNYKNVEAFVVSNLHINGETVTDHVWISEFKKRSKISYKDIVKVKGVVSTYSRSNGEVCYCIETDSLTRVGKCDDLIVENDIKLSENHKKIYSIMIGKIARYYLKNKGLDVKRVEIKELKGGKHAYKIIPPEDDVDILIGSRLVWRIRMPDFA